MSAKMHSDQATTQTGAGGTDKDGKSDNSSVPGGSGTSTSKEKQGSGEDQRMPSPPASADRKNFAKKLKIITNEHIDEYLLRLPYYHGYLLHEYQSMLLNNYGDYLLRVSVKSNEDNLKKSGAKDHNSKDSEAKGDKKARRFSVVIGVFYGKKNQPLPSSPTPPNHEKSAYSIGDDLKEIVDVPLRIEVNNEGKWTSFYIERKKKFTTIDDCMVYYKTNTAIYKDKKINLIKGVSLYSWELDRQNVILGTKKLGEGAFGEVLVGTLKSQPDKESSASTPPVSEQKTKVENLTVAIKMLKSEENSKHCVKEMMHEARLQLCMRNKNVIRTIGVCILKSPLFIVSEFCENGALREYLMKNKCEIDDKMKFCYGSARGVEYLHKKRLIHRDLAVRNILLTENKTPKISDFGLTRYGTSYTMTTKAKIPIRYLAPETINCFKYSQKTDVYTFGLVLWEIFENGAEPYRIVQPHQECAGPTGSELKTPMFKELIKKELWTKFHNDTPGQIVQFVMDRVFLTDEKKRATMTDIVGMLRNTYRTVGKGKDGLGIDRMSFR